MSVRIAVTLGGLLVRFLITVSTEVAGSWALWP
jgi:hypothetical protein